MAKAASKPWELDPIPYRSSGLKDTYYAQGNSGSWNMRIIRSAFNELVGLVTEENAEFIVRACNAHDDLLAALEGVMEEFNEVAMTCGDKCRLCDGGPDDIGQLKHEADCPLTVAVAAIGKARGGESSKQEA